MRPTTRKFLSVTIVAVFIGALPGCKPAGVQRPKRSKVVRIVVIGEGLDEPTWPVIEATGRRFAKKYALTTVDARAPRTSSPRAQQELLKSLTSESFDAACIYPTDPSAVREEINSLSQRGLAVVTIGRDVQPSRRASYCGSSSFEVGKASVLAASRILEHRNKTLMLLHGGTESDDVSKRYYGFKQGFSQTAGLQILREVNCRGNAQDAAHLVRKESRRYPRAGCWVFLDDWPLRALRRDEALVPLGETIILCNGSPRYFDRVRDGQIQAMIVYDVQKAVEESLFAAVRLVEDRRGGFAATFDVPPEIVTAKELPSYEARWKRWMNGEPTAAEAR